MYNRFEHSKGDSRNSRNPELELTTWSELLSVFSQRSSDGADTHAFLDELQLPHKSWIGLWVDYWRARTRPRTQWDPVHAKLALWLYSVHVEPLSLIPQTLRQASISGTSIWMFVLTFNLLKRNNRSTWSRHINWPTSTTVFDGDDCYL